MNSAPGYKRRSCCGKPELSVMLYGNINTLNEEDLEKWLLETVKLPFVHVNKNIHVGYGHIHFSSHEDASNFFYAYENFTFDGPTGEEDIRIKESCYFGRSKRKVVYVKAKKPIITNKGTEEGCSNDDRIEAVNQEKPCNNNDRIETTNQEKPCSNNEAVNHEKPCNNNEAVNREEPCNNNDKTEDESDFFSNTNNKKRKLDVEMSEELRDDLYYKLLPTMFKISESIQRSRDYWERSYMLGDENEKQRYKILANKELTKAINGLKKQNLIEILFS